MIAGRQESLFHKRLRKFRRIKRGYYSFVLIVSVYVLSFFLPFVMSGQPLSVKYNGGYFFPMFRFHSVTEFGVEGFGEPNYRDLRARFSTEGKGNWVLMAPYPFGPNEA